MAGDWIKMRVELPNDPAVIAIADLLEVHETHVVGMLHKAWSWADSHAQIVSQNGHAKNVTLSWLDRYIGVTGFAEAMISVGWLVNENGLKFPNFARHNGESAKKRVTATERKRLQRSSHDNVTDLSQKKADKSRTREEKRREERASPVAGSPNPLAPNLFQPDKPSAPDVLVNAENVKTWKAYKQAYRERYGVDPVRNATVNSKIAAFVKRLPADSAPAVAAFYVGSNSSYYVRDKHGTGAMLKDVEGLHTEWMTGRRVTASKALQTDKTATRGDNFREVLEELKNAEITTVA